MEKHLLVAIGDEYASSLSLRYVYGFFSRRDDVKITLFYVAPKSAAHAPRPQHSEHNPERCQTGDAAMALPALEKAKNWLLDMGYPKNNVSAKSCRSDQGIVKDIIKEGEAGLYDAVVLGRRGLSWFDEMFTDSVSHKILWEAVGFPIWVCRNPDQSRKDVLACLDGSPQSLRVADHAGFILASEPAHDITLLNIRADASADPSPIFAKAKAVLADNGVAPQRIRTRAVVSQDPAQAILKLARTEHYAAVAVGRSGDRPQALMEHIVGSTSLKLLRKLEGAALWLCK
jgi:nucleotide-binding universal stress UspA family protein